MMDSKGKSLEERYKDRFGGKLPESVAAIKSEKESNRTLWLFEVPWNKLNRAINKRPIISHKAIFLLKFFILYNLT